MFNIATSDYEIHHLIVNKPRNSLYAPGEAYTERARNKNITKLNEILIGERPGNMISFNRKPVAAIYKEDGKFYYAGKTGIGYSIITSGKWKYPILVEIRPSLDINRELFGSIIVYKKQIAKKLVYFSKNSKAINKHFTKDTIAENNFHLINEENVIDYINASRDKLYSDMRTFRDRVHLSDEKFRISEESLLHRVTGTDHPYIVTYMTRVTDEHGKIFCCPLFICLEIESAKQLVYFDKNMIESSSKKNFFGSVRKRPQNELTVERVDRPTRRPDLEISAEPGMRFVQQAVHRVDVPADPAERPNRSNRQDRGDYRWAAGNTHSWGLPSYIGATVSHVEDPAVSHGERLVPRVSHGELAHTGGAINGRLSGTISEVDLRGAEDLPDERVLDRIRTKLFEKVKAQDEDEGTLHVEWAEIEDEDE